MVRWIRPAALALALIILLAACASGDGGDDDEATTERTEAEAVESEDEPEDESEAGDDDEADVRGGEEAFASMASDAHPEPEMSNDERLEALGLPADTKPPQSGARIGSAPRDVGRCPDAWVTQAVAEHLGISQDYVYGKACDPYLYGRAAWTTYDDLKNKVAERFAQSCGDPWVTQAVMLVFHRVPQPHDCNIALYGGGQWSDFPDLLNKVWASFYTNPPPDPSWRILVLIYKNTNFAAATDPQGRAVPNTPFVAAMRDPQVQDVRNTVNQMPGIASALSGGRARIGTMDIVEVDRALSSLSPEGTQNVWVGPADVRPELDAYAPEGSYDSVIVVFRNDKPGQGGPKMSGVGPTSFGLAVGPLVGSPRERWRDGTNGAGYAMIALPGDEKPLGTTGERGYSVFLHEWLHSVEATYRDHDPGSKRDFLPDCAWNNPRTGEVENRVPLHCAEFHGFSSGETPSPMPPSPYPGSAPYGWDAWYQKFMSGEISGRSIQAEMWQRGGARTLR